MKDKKFIDIKEINEWEVETESGWKDIIVIGKTIPYDVYEVILEDDLKLKCADHHLLIKEDMIQCYVSDIKPGDKVITIYGIKEIINVIHLNYSDNMYDLQIDSDNHTYYTNGILSHNTMWLCNLAAKSVLNGHNTAYITLELQKELVHMRIGSNMLNIPLDDYEPTTKDQTLLKQKLSSLKQRSLKPLGNLHVKEFPSSTASANDVGAYLRKAQEMLGYKFDNVFIDYINIMKNWRNPNSENTYIKIKQISEDIRAMGQENNWAIISVTQTNRCLDPDSVIYHREYGKVKLGDIKINDYILGNEGYAKVKNVYVNKNTKTYKIKTKSGKEIICSGNHIFPVNNYLQPVSNTQIGDKIFIKKTNEYLDIQLIEDEIVSIEDYEIMDTIDIEVESTNRLFFANDILTHNSGWESNDLGLGSIAESAGLLHTIDILFGIVTNAEMKARGEYFLKCLANRVAGYENTRKRYTMDWSHARIEEDRNAPIQDMEFFINSISAGHTHPRGTKKSTAVDIHTAINENTQILQPPAPENLDFENIGIKGDGLF